MGEIFFSSDSAKLNLIEFENSARKQAHTRTQIQSLIIKKKRLFLDFCLTIGILSSIMTDELGFLCLFQKTRRSIFEIIMSLMLI